MTIMHFEGLMSESVEDTFALNISVEPTHSNEDETFYCARILTGQYDEDEADREGFYSTDEQFSDSDSRYFADAASDRWERNFWGD